MWYDPPTLVLGKRDVVGAWLVCFALAAVCFVLPTLTVLS
jgi:hypothetical protein